MILADNTRGENRVKIQSNVEDIKDEIFPPIT